MFYIKKLTIDRIESFCFNDIYSGSTANARTLLLENKIEYKLIEKTKNFEIYINIKELEKTLKILNKNILEVKLIQEDPTGFCKYSFGVIRTINHNEKTLYNGEDIIKLSEKTYNNSRMINITNIQDSNIFICGLHNAGRKGNLFLDEQGLQYYTHKLGIDQKSFFSIEVPKTYIKWIKRKDDIEKKEGKKIENALKYDLSDIKEEIDKMVRVEVKNVTESIFTTLKKEFQEVMEINLSLLEMAKKEMIEKLEVK